MVELCNKVCPFRPTTPGCDSCPQIYEQTQLPEPIENEGQQPSNVHSEPERIVVEPATHEIILSPEILVIGTRQKECCYLDECFMVPLQQSCDPVCYEPCNAVCTGRCRVNPECPHECDKKTREEYQLRYRIWLATKLNAIKQRYRAAAAQCLLKTRLSFVSEVRGFVTEAKLALGNLEVIGGPVPSSGGALAMNHNVQTQIQQQQQ